MKISVKIKPPRNLAKSLYSSAKKEKQKIISAAEKELRRDLVEAARAAELERTDGRSFKTSVSRKKDSLVVRVDCVCFGLRKPAQEQVELPETFPKGREKGIRRDLKAVPAPDGRIMFRKPALKSLGGKSKYSSATRILESVVSKLEE